MPLTSMGQGYQGIRGTTPETLLLDAGLLYKNVSMTALEAAGTGQYAAAIASAALMGATRGGGTYDPGKTVRQMPVDGMRFPLKNMERIEKYEPVLTVSLLEFTRDNLKLAMGNLTETSHVAYHELELPVEIAVGDYIGNVAYVGKLAGSNNPVLLVLERVYVRDAVQIKMADMDEAVLEVKLVAHADPAAPHTSPVHIYYPVGLS